MPKSKKRKKSPPPQTVQFNPKKYILEAGRKVPLHKVISDYGTHDNGLQQFFVIRKKLSGNYIVGTYLVDTFCVGLKSTTFRENLSDYELNDLINMIGQNSGKRLQEIDPNLAFNVIYGAIEYAEDLGIEIQDKDFAITEYILPDVESIDFVEIEFGKNGKPFYVNGPFDNVPKIIAALDKSVGKNNYTFLMGMGDGIGNIFDMNDFSHFDQESDDDNDEYDDYEEEIDDKK
jgi:hypothetical protein